MLMTKNRIMTLSIQRHLLQQKQQQSLGADIIRTKYKKLFYKSNLGGALYFVIVILFIHHPNVVIVLSTIVDKPLILTARTTTIKNCNAFSAPRQRLIGAFASLHRDDQLNSKQQDYRKRQCTTSSRGDSSCLRNGLFPYCPSRQTSKRIPLTFAGLLVSGHTDDNEEFIYNGRYLSSSDNSELILPLSQNNTENVDTSIIEDDEMNNNDDLDLMYGDGTFNKEIVDIDDDDDDNDDDDDDNENATIDNLIIPDISTMLGSLQLAPASEIAYFYLQNTIGLSEETMWKITNEAGSVLGFTVKNLQHKISLLKRTMNLSDDDIRTIISKQPSILHMSANRNIGPTILFLVRALDLSKADLRSMVVQFPCILCYSIQNLRAKLKFFQVDMDYHNHESDKKHDDCEYAGIDQLRKLLISEPKLLTAAVETGLKPRMKFLHKELSIPLPDLRSIIDRNPRILLYSLYDNLQTKLISFFIMRLQMTPKDVLKLLKSYPFILDYNLEDHMVPIARYFVSELEYSPTELRRILLKFPRLMTHSLFKIKHVVGYLRYTLGMDATQVKRVLFQAPQVISLSTDDTLEAKVMFLRKTFALDYDDDNVVRGGDALRKVIAGMPTLLLCSVEGNLKPKAEYLLEEFGGDAMELREAILTQPTLLGYSLEKRIRPRMKRIHEIGANPRKITVGITMKDESFEEWLTSKAKKIKDVRPSSPLPRSSPLLLPPPASSQYIQSEDTADQVTNDKEGNDSVSTLVYKNISEEERRKGRIVHWKR